MKRKNYINDDVIKIPKKTIWNHKIKNHSPLFSTTNVNNASSSQAHYIEQAVESAETSDEYSSNAEPVSDPQNITSELLYEGSKISKAEGILMTFAFITRHHITRNGSKDLMTLLNHFVPVNCRLPSNYDSLVRHISKTQSISEHHYFCSQCDEYMDSVDLQCPSCSNSYTSSELLKKGNFFTLFETKALLEAQLEDHGIASELLTNLQKRTGSGNGDGTVSDIMEGKMYRELKLMDYELTCSVNVDGVPLFKSSKCSIWPILISLNELSYGTRSKNPLTVGLWFGKGKPKFEIFFKPFVNKCKSLCQSGINWTHQGHVVSSNVYFPIFVTDSVARCMCQGIHQFNGSFGCTWCLLEGHNYKIDGSKSQKWIYTEPGSAELRTKANFVNHLTEFRSLLELNPAAKSHFGIHSASELLLLPKFDITWGLTFDVMHTAFLGIARTFLDNWLDSKNHHEPYYIGRKITQIDQRLLTFSVSYNFQRVVRSVTERRFWKASEWRTWTLLATIILKNILPAPYLHHFSTFSNGIMLLCQKRVTPIDNEEARLSLLEFSRNVEKLYGLSHCTYNCHIIIHAPKCVENWGPLWAYSAFQFENYNGILLAMCKGKQRIGIEISNQISQVHYAKCWSKTLPSSEALKISMSMLFGAKRSLPTMEIGNVKFFGPRKAYFLSRDEVSMLFALKVDYKKGRCYSFSKCTVNGILYASVNERSKKKCNFVVELDNSIYVIEKILSVPYPICIVRKLLVRSYTDSYMSYNVLKYAAKATALPLLSCRYKYICSRNANNVINDLVRLPNTIENE